MICWLHIHSPNGPHKLECRLPSPGHGCTSERRAGRSLSADASGVRCLQSGVRLWRLLALRAHSHRVSTRLPHHQRTLQRHLVPHTPNYHRLYSPTHPATPTHTELPPPLLPHTPSYPDSTPPPPSPSMRTAGTPHHHHHPTWPQQKVDSRRLIALLTEGSKKKKCHESLSPVIFYLRSRKLLCLQLAGWRV